MNDTGVIERFAQVGAVPITNKSPEDCAAFVRTQSDFWEKLIKRLGVTAG
jgi:tripartite-type tricarboxylate transporter receptor subunit TctC